MPPNTDWRAAALLYSDAAADSTRVVVNQAVKDLWQFLQSARGQDALALLKASGRHIVFGEDRPESGRTTVYLLNGKGLQKSFEAAGTWVAYAAPGQVPGPRLEPISAEQAIHAAYAWGQKQPEKVLSWLEGELDRIAEDAPAPS